MVYEIAIARFIRMPIKVREYNNGCCHELCPYFNTNKDGKTVTCGLFHKELERAYTAEMYLRCTVCCLLEIEGEGDEGGK